MNCPNCEKLERELLSALAAIEKHNSLWEDGRAEQIKYVDLSLLREHDAEVRKPLVDLLARANECLKHTEYATTIVPEIAAALAKVKEQ